MSNMWNEVIEIAFILPAADLPRQVERFGFHNAYINERGDHCGKMSNTICELLLDHFEIPVVHGPTWRFSWRRLLEMPELPAEFTDRERAVLMAQNFQRYLLLGKAWNEDDLAVYYWEGRVVGWLKGLILWNRTQEVASIYLNDSQLATDPDDDMDYESTVVITVPNPDLRLGSWKTADCKVTVTLEGESRLNRDILLVVTLQKLYLSLKPIRGHLLVEKKFRQYCDTLLLRNRASKFRSEIMAMRLPLSAEDFGVLLRAFGIPEPQRAALVDQWRSHDRTNHEARDYPHLEQPTATVSVTAPLDIERPWQDWTTHLDNEDALPKFLEYSSMVNLFSGKKSAEEGCESDARVDLEVIKPVIDRTLTICRLLNDIDEDAVWQRDE